MLFLTGCAAAQSWLEAVEAERARLREDGAAALSWDVVEQLLGADQFKTIDSAALPGTAGESPRTAAVGSAFSYDQTKPRRPS